MSDVTKSDDVKQPSDPAVKRPSVGEVLQNARAAQGKTLREVSDFLRIRLIYLEALEQSRFNDLPGPAYALGFLRSYANYLGLDANALAARFKVEKADLKKKTELVFPEPLPVKNISTAALVLAGILLLVVVYGMWWYVSDRNDVAMQASAPDIASPGAVIDMPASAPENEDALSPDLSPPADNASAENGAAPAADAVASTPAAAPVPVTPPIPAAPAAPAVVAVAAPEARVSPAAANSGIVIQATDKSWVAVYTPEGEKPLLERVMEPGEVRRFPSLDRIRLTTGNAGALIITLNGERLPLGGGAGAVRRDVMVPPLPPAQPAQ